MKDEYDFSKGKRGYFYHPNTQLVIPNYLDAGIEKAYTKNSNKPRPVKASPQKNISKTQVKTI